MHIRTPAQFPEELHFAVLVWDGPDGRASYYAFPGDPAEANRRRKAFLRKLHLQRMSYVSFQATGKALIQLKQVTVLDVADTPAPGAPARSEQAAISSVLHDKYWKEDMEQSETQELPPIDPEPKPKRE